MTAVQCHRLDGLESDNLLAFLSLLGLLRALDTADRKRATHDKLNPRIGWDIDNPPLRPLLFLTRRVTREELTESAALGLDILASTYDFDGRKDLNYSQAECRELLEREAKNACLGARERADLFAALMSDVAIKAGKKNHVDPTPLCLLFGQGHQHFLDRLAKIPSQPSPPSKGRGKNAVQVSASECLAEALFEPWHRNDRTFSFRWDPEEDVRYALMGGDPTDAAYKPGTQHGANRLAAVGVATLTLVPQMHAARVRPTIVGGTRGSGGFTFAWPIWRAPATLDAIKALLAHPALCTLAGLEELGIVEVMVARRISVGKYMNFSRARPATAHTQNTL